MVKTIFCTSMAAIAKAGPKVSDLLSGGKVSDGSDFIVDEWIKEAEGVIMSVVRYDWVTNYSSATSAGKYLLMEAATCIAAQKCIQYDPSGYTGRGEAILMLNVLERQGNRAMDLLKDQEVKTFVGGV